MPTEEKAVHIALARAVASRDLPEKMIKKATDKLSKLPNIQRIDICKYGICLDFWFPNQEFHERFRELLNFDEAALGEIRVFKYGIINPEIFHVQAELDVEEVATSGRFG